MSVTKEQWAEIEMQLSGMWGRVALVCDDYEVVAEVRSIAPLKQGILVFVNGVSKGEWFKGEAEEARKFHCERKRFLHSAKDRELAAQHLKKYRRDPALRKLYEGLDKTLSYWYPYWTNAKAFCRHLRKNSTEIEIVKIGFSA